MSVNSSSGSMDSMDSVDSVDSSPALSQGLNVGDRFKNMTVPELQEHYRNRSGKNIVMCLNPDKDRNIGSVMRTACAHYFWKCVVIGRRKVDLRSSVGMHHYIPIEYVDASTGVHRTDLDIPLINKYLVDIAKTHIIIMCELDESNVSPYGMWKKLSQDGNKGKPYAFLLGNEQNGIPRGILNCPDFEKIIVQLKMNDFVRSFNMSNTFSMISNYLLDTDHCEIYREIREENRIKVSVL